MATSKETTGKLKFQRIYPGGAKYAHVLGYKPVNLADTGIEQVENDFLAGTSDQLIGDRFKDMFTGDETGGGNVLLTLSKRAQDVAYDQMRNNQVGAKRARRSPSTRVPARCRHWSPCPASIRTPSSATTRPRLRRRSTSWSRTRTVR